MKRRKFIQASSAVTLPFMVGGNTFTAVGKNKLFNLINGDNDKVLVLVQLQGGNDGLSTLTPVDQYDRLSVVRNNILVPENSLIKITPENGLHPSMQSMADVWNEGKLNIIQSVAYPDQNRSHFRSSDIWNTASEPDEFLTTGWMGRYFDLNYSSYPEGFPNDDCPHPFALTVGTIVSETCQGTISNFSLTVTDPFNPGSVNIGAEGEIPDNCYGRELNFVRDIARQTNVYSEVISSAANQGNNLSTKYPAENANRLSEKLKHVARLISGGLQTKIYVVQLGGFDLHANLTEENNALGGSQASLLQQVSDAVCAFVDDCKLLGIEDRVLGMTYSEFGRRIRSNESFGSDHGTAAPLFVFGSCVNPTIIGENPEIDTQIDIQEGVPMQFDFRSVYASILMDWFKVDENDVRNILFEDFQHLPIVAGCEPISTDNPILEIADISLFPNPTTSSFKVQFSSKRENIKMVLYDALGSTAKLVTNQMFSAGDHELHVDIHNLPAGNYFLSFQSGTAVKTVKLVKAN